MAEIELSVFSRQCLNRRVGDEALLRRHHRLSVLHPEPALGHDRGTPAVSSNMSIREIAALERERNGAAAIIDCRSSTQSLPSATTGGRPQ